MIQKSVFPPVLLLESFASYYASCMKFASSATVFFNGSLSVRISPLDSFIAQIYSLSIIYQRYLYYSIESIVFLCIFLVQDRFHLYIITASYAANAVLYKLRSDSI